VRRKKDGVDGEGSVEAEGFVLGVVGAFGDGSGRKLRAQEEFHELRAVGGRGEADVFTEVVEDVEVGGVVGARVFGGGVGVEEVQGSGGKGGVERVD
jgi:hypothetical protein